MNYHDIYEWGKSQLTAGQIEEAQLDARLLLEAVCRTAKHDLLVHGGREVTAEEQKRYEEYIAARVTHMPLQYILGTQEFMGLNFLVDARVLIPRQDTEILVEEVLRYLQDGQSLLDMCTGSGCILLSLLHYSNYCRGVGADVSTDALAVAAENAVRLGIEALWIKSDLFTDIKGKYDIIVTNPPYISAAEMAGLMAEVGEFEPRQALAGGRDGLDFYRRIIESAGDYLFSDGMLFLEIGWRQAEAVTALLTAAGFLDITVVKDLAGLNRVISARYGGMKGV